MASSVADLVQKLDKAAAGIDRAQGEAVTAVSVMAKEVMIAGAASVNTPRTINTRKGKKGNAWGVRFLRFTSLAAPQTTVFYFGAPPYWREKGTKAHSIVPTARKKALLFNGLFAAEANVSGVSARPFWSPTKASVQRRSGAIYKAANTGALVKAGFGT